MHCAVMGMSEKDFLRSKRGCRIFSMHQKTSGRSAMLQIDFRNTWSSNCLDEQEPRCVVINFRPQSSQSFFHNKEREKKKNWVLGKTLGSSWPGPIWGYMRTITLKPLFCWIRMTLYLLSEFFYGVIWGQLLWNLCFVELGWRFICCLSFLSSRSECASLAVSVHQTSSVFSWSFLSFGSFQTRTSTDESAPHAKQQPFQSRRGRFSPCSISAFSSTAWKTQN